MPCLQHPDPSCRPARREARAVRGSAARRRRGDPPRRRHRPPRAPRGPRRCRCAARALGHQGRRRGARGGHPAQGRRPRGRGAGQRRRARGHRPRRDGRQRAHVQHRLAPPSTPIALLLAAARHIPAADASLRQGQWKRSSFTGVELYGKTVGIVGLGKIGQLVAQRLAAFDVELVAYDPYVAPARAAQLGIELLTPRRAARPRRHDLDPPAQDAGDARAHRQGPARADQAGRDRSSTPRAAASSTRTRWPRRCARGHVGGAGIDVYVTEPTTASPLFELPQVVVTPHLGASTDEAQDRAGTDVARSVQLALARRVRARRGERAGRRRRRRGGRGRGCRWPRSSAPCCTRWPGGCPASVTVDVAGELAAEDVSVLPLAALRGLFTARRRRAGHVRQRAGAGRRRAGVGVELDHGAGERELPQRRAAAGRDARRRGDHRLRHAHRPGAGGEARRGQRPALRPAGRGRGRAAGVRRPARA